MFINIRCFAKKDSMETEKEKKRNLESPGTGRGRMINGRTWGIFRALKPSHVV